MLNDFKEKLISLKIQLNSITNEIKGLKEENKKIEEDKFKLDNVIAYCEGTKRIKNSLKEKKKKGIKFTLKSLTFSLVAILCVIVGALITGVNPTELSPVLYYFVFPSFTVFCVGLGASKGFGDYISTKKYLKSTKANDDIMMYMYENQDKEKYVKNSVKYDLNNEKIKELELEKDNILTSIETLLKESSKDEEVKNMIVDKVMKDNGLGFMLQLIDEQDENTENKDGIQKVKSMEQPSKNSSK